MDDDAGCEESETSNGSIIGPEEDHVAAEPAGTGGKGLSEVVQIGAADLTLDRLLDTPYWSSELKEARFETLRQLEEALMKWESVLQQGLVTYDYNTFGSYVEFYQNYQTSKQSLFDFILSYQPRITTESMSCVALSLFLMKHLSQTDPVYGSLFSLVSCEEMVLTSAEVTDCKLQDAYQLESKDNVKEHVLVCLKFALVDEGRSGYVLFDPGYHIARPIVVMNDAAYPHTAWFTASSNRKVVKDYHYQVINDQYIAWKVRESTKHNPAEVLRQYVNIIYIKKEFIKYANVTEKRCLIFSMKSYVVRSRKGVVAGFYSWIDEKNLTVFYEEDGERMSRKFHIDEIGTDSVKQALYKVAGLMENNFATTVDERVEKLLLLLARYKESLYDAEFCPELCEIDKWIEEE